MKTKRNKLSHRSCSKRSEKPHTSNTYHTLFLLKFMFSRCSLMLKVMCTK